MRTVLGLMILLVACGPAERPPPSTPGPSGARPDTAHAATVPITTPPPPPTSTSPSTSTGAPCVVVGSSTSVEGTLHGSGGMLSLRLDRARCVVGLTRAGYLTEVAIATAGPDLRPLIESRVRIHGDVIAGENDLGGPALIVLAKDIERMVRESDDP